MEIGSLYQTRNDAFEGLCKRIGAKQENLCHGSRTGIQRARFEISELEISMLKVRTVRSRLRVQKHRENE